MSQNHRICFLSSSIFLDVSDKSFFFSESLSLLPPPPPVLQIHCHHFLRGPKISPSLLLLLLLLLLGLPSFFLIPFPPPFFICSSRVASGSSNQDGMPAWPHTSALSLSLLSFPLFSLTEYAPLPLRKRKNGFIDLTGGWWGSFPPPLSSLQAHTQVLSTTRGHPTAPSPVRGSFLPLSLQLP